MDKIEGSMNMAERRWNNSENRISEMRDVGRNLEKELLDSSKRDEELVAHELRTVRGEVASLRLKGRSFQEC